MLVRNPGLTERACPRSLPPGRWGGCKSGVPHASAFAGFDSQTPEWSKEGQGAQWPNPQIDFSNYF